MSKRNKNKQDTRSNTTPQQDWKLMEQDTKKGSQLQFNQELEPNRRVDQKQNLVK